MVAGCAASSSVDATLRPSGAPCGDGRWAWLRSWRKAIEDNNVELLSSLASPEASFRVYVCSPKDETREKLTVSKAEWLRDVRNSYSNEDDYVKISAAGDSGPVAEIRGWDKAGDWRYSIVAGLKDSAHGTITATKMELWRFPGEP